MKKTPKQATGHSGANHHYQIGVRVSGDVRKYYEEIASKEARTLSSLCAMILEDYKNRMGKGGDFKTELQIGKQKFSTRGNSRRS